MLKDFLATVVAIAVLLGWGAYTVSTVERDAEAFCRALDTEGLAFPSIAERARQNDYRVREHTETGDSDGTADAVTVTTFYTGWGMAEFACIVRHRGDAVTGIRFATDWN
jgi:hypothetical protein